MLGTKWPFFDDPTYYDDPITWMHVDCANTHCCAVLTASSCESFMILVHSFSIHVNYVRFVMDVRKRQVICFISLRQRAATA